MEEDYISPNEIPQGALVFIFHHKKPLKTGWWRKTRQLLVAKGTKNIYILEKSFASDFSYEADEIKNSRIEDSLCVMNESTVKTYAFCPFNEKKDIEMQYEIMAVAVGTVDIGIKNHNYLLDNSSLEFYRKIQGFSYKIKFCYTNRFKELMDKKFGMQDLSNIDSYIRNHLK